MVELPEPSVTVLVATTKFLRAPVDKPVCGLRLKQPPMVKVSPTFREVVVAVHPSVTMVFPSTKTPLVNGVPP